MSTIIQENDDHFTDEPSTKRTKYLFETSSSNNEEGFNQNASFNSLIEENFIKLRSTNILSSVSPYLGTDNATINNMSSSSDLNIPQCDHGNEFALSKSHPSSCHLSSTNIESVSLRGNLDSYSSIALNKPPTSQQQPHQYPHYQHSEQLENLCTEMSNPTSDKLLHVLSTSSSTSSFTHKNDLNCPGTSNDVIKTSELPAAKITCSNIQQFISNGNYITTTSNNNSLLLMNNESLNNSSDHLSISEESDVNTPSIFCQYQSLITTTNTTATTTTKKAFTAISNVTTKSDNEIELMNSNGCNVDLMPNFTESNENNHNSPKSINNTLNLFKISNSSYPITTNHIKDSYFPSMLIHDNLLSEENQYSINEQSWIISENINNQNYFNTHVQNNHHNNNNQQFYLPFNDHYKKYQQNTYNHYEMINSTKNNILQQEKEEPITCSLNSTVLSNLYNNNNNNNNDNYIKTKIMNSMRLNSINEALHISYQPQHQHYEHSNLQHQQLNINYKDLDKSDDKFTRIFIWDLDETLIIFHTLLTGYYAHRYGKDPAVAGSYGLRMEELIYNLADTYLFFNELEECDQVHIDDIRGDDNYQDLMNYRSDNEAYGENSSTISQSIILSSSSSTTATTTTTVHASMTSSLETSSPINGSMLSPPPISSVAPLTNMTGEIPTRVNTPTLHGSMEWMRKLGFRYRRIREIYNYSRHNVSVLLGYPKANQWIHLKNNLDILTDHWLSMAIKATEKINNREDSVNIIFHWPFWRINTHSDLNALNHALDLGYL
uniref:Eyes absent homolog n=1 Tax=Schistosoma haematobium TaxID=6185 RepID=A0A095AFN9_SCHHA